MAPATGDGAVASSKSQSSNNTTNKNLKGHMCPHIVKSLSMPGLRKALKSDIKSVCSKAPCNNVVENSQLENSSTSLKWMCLQCGNIGCGDNTGQGGHAKIHFTTPRSDYHHLAVLFHGNLEKAWCFGCGFEIDTSTPFFKDVIPFLRRHIKVKTALSQNTPPVVSHVPIVLGPPPPPPVPKIDPPKPFPLRGKQNYNRNGPTMSTSRWDESGDWPLGLENLGNTCFMNSALQCLSRTRSLNNKLDLYGAGNIIEILVTSEEPYVQIINTNVEKGGESDFISDECERFIERGLEGITSGVVVDSSDLGSGGLSPSSTEMDSLLDVASASSSKSDGSVDAVDKEQWNQELEQELRKPLRLRLSISKESMASKLRHCFKAITRSQDISNSGDSYDRSEFYCRGNNLSTVFSPRAVQLSVSRLFRLGQQHDSHELLRTVVDMMKKDQIKAFRLAIMQRYGVKKSEGKNCDPKVAELLKMWDRKLYHKTFVDEIFGGELVTFQECLQCKSVRRSHEEFLDISLPIRVFRANPNPSTKKSYSLFDDDYNYVINRSVEDCLRAYTEPEFLTGSNVVECEYCHRLNLERLAAGVDFDEVFPGVNKAVEPKSSENTGKSKYQQKNHSKKRQSRQAKIKSKLTQSSFVQENSDMGAGSSLKIVEDHFKSDQAKLLEKSAIGTASEEDAKSSKSGSLDDYVVIQSTPMVKEIENKNGLIEMEMDFVDLPDLLDTCPTTITGDKGVIEANDKETPDGINTESNLSRGLSTSLKSLSLIENGMDVDLGGPIEEDEEMVNHDLDNNDDEDMDDLDEPAVDGVGNASDVEDEEEGNGLPQLDLGFTEDKPISSVAEYLTVPVLSGTRASTVGDEGFSEGENSIEEKNSQSLSGSSSRNSISEADNMASESSEKTLKKKIPVTKCPCSRRQLISRPPQCLTLHLKRFQHTGRGSSKLGDAVTFPYILNLTEFCSEAEEDLNKPGYKTIFDEDGEVVYSLYGIVEHSGSLHFGHYVAYIKVEGKREGGETGSGDRAPDKWFYVSDSLVSSSNLKTVLRQDAYIMFYERIRGVEKKERLFQYSNLINGDVPSYGYENTTDTAADWSSTSSVSYNSFNYKPTTVPIVPPQWDENWEDSSTQQVSSSNDNGGTLINYSSESTAATDSVSSSTLSYPVPLLGIDSVSSSTDTDVMDYCGPVNTSTSAHPLWDDDEVRKGSALFDDIPDLMDDSTCCNNPLSNLDTVSSSSDVTANSIVGSGTFTKLEDVD